MIKASELRIGNLVQAKRIDDALPWVTIVKGSGTRLIHVELKPYEPHVGIWLKPDEILPIPLAPEWLERCGFEKVTKYFDLKTSFGCLRYFDNEIMLFLGDEYQLSISMDYDTIPLPGEYKCVHQLQNIFFDLAHEELTIKEPA